MLKLDLTKSNSIDSISARSECFQVITLTMVFSGL